MRRGCRRISLSHVTADRRTNKRVKQLDCEWDKKDTRQETLLLLLGDSSDAYILQKEAVLDCNVPK
jgi:hypothetical protein